MGALMSLGRRLLLTLLLASVACRPPKGPAYSDHRVITEDEIDASNATTAYDVIARLRADFLRTRGPTSLLLPSRGEAVVFLNDQEYGAIDALRSVRAAVLPWPRSGDEVRQPVRGRGDPARPTEPLTGLRPWSM